MPKSSENETIFDLRSKTTISLDSDLLSTCIHCGLCLPACPTYLATGKETESPRGRIHLLSLLQKGELELNKRLADHIDSCLGCMGCQTACPSGVKYEAILSQARPLLVGLRNPKMRRITRFVFKDLLPNYKRLEAFGKILRLWQLSGGKKYLETSPWLKPFLGKLSDWQQLLPIVPAFAPLPKLSWCAGEKQAQIQFFSGCVMNIFYNHVNHASIRLLTAQRQIVKVPQQTCCGALAAHAGELDIAHQLAKSNIEFFEHEAGDIVASAAGCSAMLKGYRELLAHDTSWADRAAGFAARVSDVSEFLANHVFLKQPRPLKRKVAYHAACHLAHVQNIRSAPAQLLNAVPGLELITLTEQEHCCGSAGIFNLTHTTLSHVILERKLEYLKDSGADWVVTTNPGCLLQLEAGLAEQGLSLRVCHLVELLDEAYNQEEG